MYAEVVQCKDCKYRPVKSWDGNKPFARYSPPTIKIDDQRSTYDWRCPFLCSNGFYSECPEDNFFCKYGEVRDDVIYGV